MLLVSRWPGNSRGSKEARARASAALHNIVHSQPDDKRGRREIRVLHLLEQVRHYCEACWSWQENHERGVDQEDNPSEWCHRQTVNITWGLGLGCLCRGTLTSITSNKKKNWEMVSEWDVLLSLSDNHPPFQLQVCFSPFTCWPVNSRNTPGFPSWWRRDFTSDKQLMVKHTACLLAHWRRWYLFLTHRSLVRNDEAFFSTRRYSVGAIKVSQFNTQPQKHHIIYILYIHIICFYVFISTYCYLCVKCRLQWSIRSVRPSASSWNFPSMKNIDTPWTNWVSQRNKQTTVSVFLKVFLQLG